RRYPRHKSLELSYPLLPSLLIPLLPDRPSHCGLCADIARLCADRAVDSMQARVVSRKLEFRVLGPVEVVHDGVATRVGSATQRTLLALLLMHPNEVVSTDRLLDVLWADNSPEARRKLWFHVSKLRGMLRGRRARDDAGGILVTRPTGYALRVDLDQPHAARLERPRPSP